MMSENDPFLVLSQKSQISIKRDRKWRPFDFFLFAVLFAPIVMLFVVSQAFIYGYRKDEIKVIPMTVNSTNPLGFPLMEKSTLQPYNYDTLQPCVNRTLYEGLNTTIEWQKMKECNYAILQRFFGNPEGVLPNFANVLYVCDDAVEMSGFEMRDLPAKRRTFNVMLPKCKSDENLLVNLGVDDDTTAEEQLKQSVKNLRLFAASPDGLNNTMYERVFQGAVNEQNLEKYINSELAGKKFIDMMWINDRNGAFEMHKWVEKGGLFEKLNLTVCQIGLEVKNTEHLNFYTLMLYVLNEFRYLFLRPSNSDDGQLVRVVMMNVANEKCFMKYFM